MTDRSEFWYKKWQHFSTTGNIYVGEDYFCDMHDILYLSRLLTEKILFLTVGVSGSGKTTFSTMLEKEYDCVVYEQDVMIVDGIGFYEQMRMYNYMLNRSNLVCVDSTNITSDMRQRFIHPARQKGFTIVAVVFDEDKQTIIDRNVQRGNMDLEKIIADYDRLEFPLPTTETDMTITYKEFVDIFEPLFLKDRATTFDLRSGWII